jgi:hypothetical protein
MASVRRSTTITASRCRHRGNYPVKVATNATISCSSKVAASSSFSVWQHTPLPMEFSGGRESSRAGRGGSPPECPVVDSCRARGHACRTCYPDGGTVRDVWSLPRRPESLTGLSAVVIVAATVTGCGSGDSTVAKTPQAAPTIAKVVSELPRDPRSQQPWNPEPLAGNYNECAQLSAVIVKANTNADNPTTRAVMFHLGKYIPQGVPDTYGFNGIDTSQCTGDTVALTYPSGIGVGSVVKFRWNGNGVEVVGNTGG